MAVVHALRAAAARECSRGSLTAARWLATTARRCTRLAAEKIYPPGPAAVHPGKQTRRHVHMYPPRHPNMALGCRRSALTCRRSVRPTYGAPTRPDETRLREHLGPVAPRWPPQGAPRHVEQSGQRRGTFKMLNACPPRPWPRRRVPPAVFFMAREARGRPIALSRPPPAWMSMITRPTVRN